MTTDTPSAQATVAVIAVEALDQCAPEVLGNGLLVFGASPSAEPNTGDVICQKYRADTFLPQMIGTFSASHFGLRLHRSCRSAEGAGG